MFKGEFSRGELPREGFFREEFSEKIVFQSKLERENSNDAEMHGQFQIEEPIVEIFENCFSDFDEADLEQGSTGSPEKYLDNENEDFMSSIADEELDPHRETHGPFYKFKFQIFSISQIFKTSAIMLILFVQILWRWMCKILMPYDPGGAEGYRELHKDSQNTCRDLQRVQMIPSDPVNCSSYEEMLSKDLSYPFDPGGGC